MTLAQSIKNGQTLRMPAGPAAIARNDLVALGGYPLQLYPVQNADCAAVANAGGAAVATTTVTASASNFETRDRAILDPDTLDLFYANTHSGAAGNQQGCKIWKFNSAGVLQREVKLDDGGGSFVYVQVRWLTNGNILVTWQQVGTPYSMYFAILDKALNVLVAKTLIASVATNPRARLGAVAINGGGFALAYAHAGTGSYFAVYNSAGAAVYGPTLIAGAPTNTSTNSTGPGFKLVLLSNGNIFVAIFDSSTNGPASDPARYCIFNPTGGVVKAYTVLAGYGGAFAGGSANENYPEVDVMNGFVCMALASQRAFVINNAGTLQGVPTQLMQGNASCRVKSDGTYFWVFSTGQNSSGGMQIDRIATNGSKVTTAVPAPSSLYADVLYERGQFILFDGAKAYFVVVDAAGNATVASSTTFASGDQTLGGIGDFCAVALATGTFTIAKYMNAAIVGIAQADVAAGNAGTLVSVNPGPGAYPTNAYKGTPGRAFDHSAATISGCKGVLYANSVNLKGL